MSTLIKALLIKAGKIPETIEINNELESYQTAVGGLIQAIYPFDDSVALICNEEGKLLGLDLNRSLRDEDGNIYDIIAGNFLVVGLGDSDFSGLSEELLEKYKDIFKNPEFFMPAGRTNRWIVI